MKRFRFLLAILAVVLVFGLVSCSEPEAKYYVAVYAISQATYDNMRWNITPVDALDWVRSQPGTGAAPNLSSSGLTVQGVLDYIEEKIGFSDDWRNNTLKPALESKGYWYGTYRPDAGGYRFLYINKE